MRYARCLLRASLANLRSDELVRASANAEASKHEADGESSGSDDAGIPDEAANPAGIRTDGACCGSRLATG